MIKQIEGHPHYFVTDSGEVLSDLTKDRTLRVLSPDMSTGHPRVTIDGEKNYISNLVINAFKPYPGGAYKVWHINGDNTDNDIENLIWVTNSDVQNYSRYSKEYLAKFLSCRRNWLVAP